MKTRRNKRSKLHYTSKKYGGGITPKYKADNVVEYIDGTEVTIIEQLSYKNGEWQYKIQFPDKSYRIIPESSIKRFIRKGDFMTVRVREHERELAAFAKEHPNWKRKSKPKAWNIESSDATSFEDISFLLIILVVLIWLLLRSDLTNSTFLPKLTFCGLISFIGLRT